MIRVYACYEYVGKLIIDGYSAYWNGAVNSDHNTCQFLRVSAFHVLMYTQCILQKFAYLDEVYIFS
jgi:hypothetical protein